MIEFLGPIAPAGTPKPIIEQIAKATRTVVAERAYQHMLIESGLEPCDRLGSTPWPSAVRSDWGCLTKPPVPLEV
jgi:tripartite-type tricarboxylate transporter receptor subunit TctC